MNDVRAIILAAGKGVRMQSELPKVLHPLLNKPLISHVIDNIRQAGIDNITVVVGYKGEEVIETVGVGSSVSFAWQREQLGTGHAVLQAKDFFKDFSGKILVACGDAPLISAQSFSSLYNELKDSSVKASVLTMMLQNPKGYGRMIKATSGSLTAIVEEKDATPEQKLITEVNSGTYMFDSQLLFTGLLNIKSDNAQNEYYLTDVIEYIVKKGHRVTTVPLLKSSEGRGINSKEELRFLEEELNNGKVVL